MIFTESCQNHISKIFLLGPSAGMHLKFLLTNPLRKLYSKSKSAVFPEKKRGVLQKNLGFRRREQLTVIKIRMSSFTPKMLLPNWPSTLQLEVYTIKTRE